MAKDITQVKHEIAQAAQDAVKVISNATAEALKVSSAATNNDHELLIRMDEKLLQVIKDVGDLKTNTVSRIDQLEVNSVSKIDYKESLDILDRVDSKSNYYAGGLAIITIFLIPLIWIVLNHLAEDSGQKTTILELQKDHIETDKKLDTLLNK
jgi:hypothetical protein